MSIETVSAEGSAAPHRGVVSRWRRNEDGVTAIEFGMVAFPFLLFVLGIMAVGLQFFTINSLDHAVETASRKIRTGEAQRNNLTLGDFKQMVCDASRAYIEYDCERVVVHVQSAANWAGIDPSACASGGTLTPPSDSNAPLADSSGGAEQVVLVTVCYDWQMPITFPYLRYMLMKPIDGIPLASGGALIQAVATFRTEPYN